jgi:hypothetical protein
MQVMTVTYGYRFGRPGYSSENIELTAALDPGEDAATATLLLKAEVLRLGGDERGAEAALAEVYQRVNRPNGPKGEGEGA